MVDAICFLPCGSDGFLVELPDLQSTMALYDKLLADGPEGVVDLVPAARTLMVRFDPLIRDRATLLELISAIDLSAHDARQGETFDIPVLYDGEDLGDVADILGWSVKELIRRHTNATYTAAFAGFVPGYVYMICDDPAFNVPRRKSPRVRVPAGAVALGGKFGCVYPSASPGGWQLIGRTPLKMWDTNRPRAALLAAGDKIRFREIDTDSVFPVGMISEDLPECVKPSEGLRVIRADRPALYQDLGRHGYTDQGLSESGALDRASLVEANLCVGNPRDATTVEIAYGGFGIRADRAVTLAIAGAPTPAVIYATDGTRSMAPFLRPFALDAGDELMMDFPDKGTRTYLAMRGGFAVETVLGSTATNTLANVGPPPIGVDDYLVPAGRPSLSVDPLRVPPIALPKAGDTITLDVLLGPRTDWFTQDSLSTFLTQVWQVTSESSRVGMRLAGSEPLQKRDAIELPSEATPTGAIQVPHSGQPVLFLADHPVTGGYPVIGVVARHLLDLAGQIPIGANIRFNAIGSFSRHFG